MRTVGLYGRRAAVHPVGLRLISSYMDELPSAPAVFDHSNGFDHFSMLGNGPDPTLTVNGGNPVGDCGVVGSVNITLVDSVETAEAFVVPTSDEVVSTYLGYTNGQDSGIVLSDFLAHWQSAGLPWGKIAGYAGVEYHEVDDVFAAANAFGCLYVGIAVPAPAEDQFSNGEPWDLTGTSADDDIQGGHCVVIVARNAEGGEVITWGQRQKFTNRWWKRYGEEAYAVIAPSQVEKLGNGYGLDITHLKEDLSKLRDS